MSEKTLDINELRYYIISSSCGSPVQAGNVRVKMKQVIELGVAPHVSEKILGHKLTGMLAVYDQYDYIPEQQDAAELWAKKIQECSEINPLSISGLPVHSSPRLDSAAWLPRTG